MSLATSTLDAIAAPLDALRGSILRALGRRSPSLARVISDRERRVNAMVIGGLFASLALTIAAPLWLLALGPVLLGGAHLASDVRYLVVREGLHRRALAWVLVAAPLAIGALTSFGSRAFVLSIVGGALVARADHAARKAAVTLVALALAAVVFALPRQSELAIAHAHNFIAVLLWLAWRPRKQRAHWVALALFVAANVALVTGALDPAVRWASGLARGPSALPIGLHMNALAPWPEHIDLSRRVVLAFAFSQSVHYAMWLRAIPEVARRSPTPRTFRQSVRAMSSELGPRGSWVVLVAVAACVGLALWAAVDLVSAREGYLRFALFHGYLELAVVAWLVAERGAIAP
ncbi:MAG: hypothetical protein JNK05_37345 [Myxococcales bacterium]|nr:hypothetical protein [Myxococcales bacterium]